MQNTEYIGIIFQSYNIDMKFNVIKNVSKKDSKLLFDPSEMFCSFIHTELIAFSRAFFSAHS